MKLGLQLGYWGAGPPSNAGDLVVEAERAGFDAVFAAESWGSDAFTPLAWWGSATTRVRLGTSVAQLSARTPTAAAMHALTLDHLSNGRTILGLGVSGPQVVEGWYGAPFDKPLARTREYVSIIRQVLARQAPVSNAGPHYPLPYRDGLGKALRPIVHPLRSDLPIWLGAEGPRNVALAGEIADGWLAIYYSPRMAEEYNAWLAEGFVRRGGKPSDFEVAASAQVVITDDPAAEIANLRPVVALYAGGMGAATMNFHADVFARMGYAATVDEVGRMFRAGRRDEATAAVPDELVREIAIIGSAAEVREQIQTWEKSGVTMMLVSCRDVEQIRMLADVVKHVLD